MIRIRVAFLLANAMLLAFATAAYLSDHGGFDGDYEFLDPGYYDVLTSKPGPGDALFSRWTFKAGEESRVVRLFLFVNLPAFVCSRLAFEIGQLGFCEMRGISPFGLSYATYIISLGLILSFLQWYLIGTLVENSIKRYRSGEARRLNSPPSKTGS